MADMPFQGWLNALRVYRQPRVIAMIFLGFSAGLPFLLVFSNLCGLIGKIDSLCLCNIGVGTDIWNCDLPVLIWVFLRRSL